MKKLINLLILINVVQIVGSSQKSWFRSESNSKLEVGDVAITSNNNYFISLKNNHFVFYSGDSGATWTQAEILNENYKYYKSIDRPYLKPVGDKLYCVSCTGGSKRAYYNGIRFESTTGVTYTNSENLFFDQNNNSFYKDFQFVARTDSNWNWKHDSNLFKVPDGYSINSTNFYIEDNNYISTLDFKGSIKIYKINTGISGHIETYATFNVSKNTRKTFVSRGGTIYYLDVNDINRNFKYVSRNNLSKVELSKLQTNNLVSEIYFYHINANNEIYLLTNRGVFINNGIDEDQWQKCYQMSDQIPLPPDRFTTIFDAKYFFKDSLNAIISYGDNCGQADYWCFTPKYKSWKSIKLDFHIDNLKNLVKDKNGRLYAYRPCKNYFGRNYLQSYNNGKDWELMILNGEFVTSVGINMEGEAIAILSNNSLFLHSSINDEWNKVSGPVSQNSQIRLFHIYSANNDLLLTGNANFGLPNEVNYLFHSRDGGQTWSEISPFVQRSYHPFNDFKFYIDHSGNWLVYQTENQWNPNNILISKNKGLTWSTDSRFINFYPVVFIHQLTDNRYLISGDWNFTKQGTFLVDSTGHLDFYSANYEKNPCVLFFNQLNQVFGYPTYEGDSKPFYSNDLGITLINDDSGIMPTDIESRIIESAIYTKSDQITLNLQYDGIYNTNNDIFSSISDNKLQEDRYNIFKNENSIRIIRKDGKGWSKGETALLYDILGRTYKMNFLLESEGLIDARTINSGIYFLKIIDELGKFQIARVVFN